MNHPDRFAFFPYPEEPFRKRNTMCGQHIPCGIPRKRNKRMQMSWISQIQALTFKPSHDIFIKLAS